MNRIANYLNGHLTGEVVAHEATLNSFSQDRGAFKSRPNCVVFAQNSDDICKTMRLCAQLAERGKHLTASARGYGNDFTGASLTSDIMINTSRHFNEIIDFDPDQALIHVQSGADLATINLLTKTQGLVLPLTPTATKHSIGGVIANNLIYPFTSKSNLIHQMIDQLEIVLADGTTLQTKRLSKRELNRKIGLQTTEGRIYREIDKLIEDNHDLISKIDSDVVDNSGYANIARVKSNNSFDLSPLFVGSQGTLGVITEAILRLQDYQQNVITVWVGFATLSDAMDAVDDLLKLKPTVLDIFEHKLFQQAAKQGRVFATIEETNKRLDGKTAYHLLIEIPIKNRLFSKQLMKKISAIIERTNGVKVDNPVDLQTVRDLPQSLDFSSNLYQNVGLAQGAMVPRVRWHEFAESIAKIESVLGTALPIYGSALTNVLNLQSSLDLSSMADKQKVIKISDAYCRLATSLDGVACASGGEGLAKGMTVSKQTTPELLELYSKIKQIFDSHNILTPEIKTSIDLRAVASRIANRAKNDFSN